MEFIFALFAVVTLFPEYQMKYLLFFLYAPIPVESGYALFGFFVHTSQYNSTWFSGINLLVKFIENEDSMHLMYKHHMVSFFIDQMH